jgi:hypothetical protein
MQHSAGTPLERVYALMTFGIPKDTLPINDDGSIDLSHNPSFLQTLQSREESSSNETSSLDDDTKNEDAGKRQEYSAATTTSKTSKSQPSILIPDPMDVLMGRGKQPGMRPGALRMHHLIVEHMEEYEATSKWSKAAVVGKILDKMKEAGCRFLIAVSGGYVECDDLAAREKISHGCRNLKAKNKKKEASSGKNNNERKLRVETKKKRTLRETV